MAARLTEASRCKPQARSMDARGNRPWLKPGPRVAPRERVFMHAHFFLTFVLYFLTRLLARATIGARFGKDVS